MSVDPRKIQSITVLPYPDFQPFLKVRIQDVRECPRCKLVIWLAFVPGFPSDNEKEAIKIANLFLRAVGYEEDLKDHEAKELFKFMKMEKKSIPLPDTTTVGPSLHGGIFKFGALDGGSDYTESSVDSLSSVEEFSSESDDEMVEEKKVREKEEENPMLRVAREAEQAARLISFVQFMDFMQKRRLEKMKEEAMNKMDGISGQETKV